MPPDPSPDALLVARARQGDRAAWGELYERYADRLHDYAARLTGSRTEAGDCVQDAFVLAVHRIGQLRDPDKVRPWLYAIVRSTAHRHYRRVDRWAFGEVPDAPAAGHGEDTVIAGLSSAELTELVAEAAAGLTEDDRELLDLSLRHDLVPADIAAALGVSSNHASVTTERMRERLGRAITVTVLARRPECTDLAALAAKEGPLTPLSRKRLARHVDACTTCAAQAERQVRPEALLAVAPLPLLLLPRRAFADFAPEIDAALEAARRGAQPDDGGLEWGSDGFPVRPASRRRRGWLVAAVVVGGLFVGGAVVGGVGNGGDRRDVEEIAATATTDSVADAGPGVPAGEDTDASGTVATSGASSAPSATEPPLDGAPAGAGHGGSAGDAASASFPAGGNSREDPALPPADSPTTTAVANTPTTRAPSGPSATTAPPAPTSVGPTGPGSTTAPTTSTTTPPAGPPTTVAPTAPPTTADTTGPTIGAVTASVGDLTVVSGGSGICKQPPTYTSSYPTTVTVSVSATDASGVASVSFTWTTGTASGGGGMSPSGGTWTASVGPLDPSAAPLGGSTGEVTYPLSVTITATDAGGHSTSTTRSGLATVHNCYVIL